jgi:endonuclease/exonuclease/phosphatase family metal-dependent hydrolase
MALRKSVLALCALAFPLSALAQPNRLPLDVVSYNIKGLPSFTLSSDFTEARFGLIGKLLGAENEKHPTIVLLQEAFASPVENLFQAAKYPYRAAGPAARSFLGVSSGLFVLSPYPIVEESAEAFSPDDCESWDCFSNKGVQFARIAVPGIPQTLEVFNTHLQSGWEDNPARMAQVKVLLSFYAKHHHEGSPVIFGGDFNFRPGLGHKSFELFSSGIKFLHAGKTCLEQGCAATNDRGWRGVWNLAVDHQFYSGSGPVRIAPVLVERKYHELVENQLLSDHPSLEVHYELSWDAAPPAARALASTRRAAR